MTSFVLASLVVGALALTACANSPARSAAGSNSGAAPTADQITAAMGTGFNLGNAFDLGLQPTNPNEVGKLIDLYQGAGMKHIRIPVTWMDGFQGSHLADATGRINASSPRLKELDAVVDYALGKGLIVILNTHHEHWLKRSYDGSPRFNEPFTRLWTGIAKRYENRSPNLVFEVLNEPEGAMGDWSGAVRPNDPGALARTRQINDVGYRAIRATGGANSTRVIMVSPNGQGNHSMLDDVYPDAASLPGGGKDDFLIATVHTYDPWNFCGEDGRLEEKPTMESVRNSILAVSVHAKKLGIPVNYGEYGVGRRDRQNERNSEIVREYYKTVRTATLALGMSNTPWDDLGWFGLTARQSDGTVRFVFDIVPVMMR